VRKNISKNTLVNYGPSLPPPLALGFLQPQIREGCLFGFGKSWFNRKRLVLTIATRSSALIDSKVLQRGSVSLEICGRRRPVGARTQRSSGVGRWRSRNRGDGYGSPNLHPSATRGSPANLRTARHRHLYSRSNAPLSRARIKVGGALLGSTQISAKDSSRLPIELPSPNLHHFKQQEGSRRNGNRRYLSTRKIYLSQLMRDIGI